MTQSHAADTRRKMVPPRVIIWDCLRFVIYTLPLTGLAGWLGYESTQDRKCLDLHSILVVAHWFDPVFFQYNLLLCAIAVLVVPSVPLLYVRSMAWQKEARLSREIPEDKWCRYKVASRLQIRSEFKFYFGSTVLASLVVAFGMSILLLFKPVLSADLCGVDFSKGANILMMGPYIGGYHSQDPQALEIFYKHLISSLVGFQFGFLGAYIYFLTSLSRAYFLLDLTPGTMVEGSIRMAVASVVSLVLSFLLSSGAETMRITEVMPVLSFFFGFFPKRAMAFLEQSVLKIVKTLSIRSYKAIPLSVLHGMTYNHELRLEREGFDDVENLSHASPIDLAVRTGISYSQLQHWISEAWLAAHLREDYPEFVTRTGILSRAELQDLFAHRADCPITDLIPTNGADSIPLRLQTKIAVIRILLQSPNAGHAG
jgi:hypothetical protein